MPDSSQPAGNSRKAHGPAPPWLRLGSVCVVLIAVPVGLYLFLYQRSRIEDATIRNFRALDAAAVRVDQVLRRLSAVVESSSFGIPPDMLNEVTDRLTDHAPACGGERGFRYRGWHRPAFPYHLLPSRRTTAAERLEYRYWLAARKLFESNQGDGGGYTEALWNHLHCLIDTHRRFSGPDATVSAGVDPLPRTALRPLDPACVYSGDPGCRRLRELLEAEPCGAQSPRLNADAGGMAATVIDCRRLEERHVKLHNALKSFHGSEAVIGAIDLFGTRSAADLEELMEQATGYLSRFFDSHLIADADGLILFETEAASLAGTEVDESQVETPGFSSFVNIAEFLRAGSPHADGSGAGDASDGGNARAAVSAPAFRGRSFERVVSDQDIAVRVFVHPFILDRVAVSSGSAREDAQAGSASPGAAARPTFYLVGVVDDREFRSAAIRLRLGWVTNGTLALLGLLTLTPLLWFWTAGDRAVFGRLALLVVGGLPVVGVVLFTVLVCAVVTNRLDEHVLDGAMKHVSGRIAELFDRELSREIHRLDGAVPRLLPRPGREVPPLGPGGAKLRPRTAGQDDRTLTLLEREFYCDDADRNLDYDPDRPEPWSAFVLSAEGTQRVCLSEPRRARPARTPALDLRFRDYFTHPRDGVLWRSPSARRGPVGCRIGATQDEESLIPCLVDRLPEPSKRWFGVFGAPPGGEAAYFLERIDSVVGGRVATILAVNTGRTATPVAAANVSLNALDRAVPPRHVDFAVVERETGRTLFHSDGKLAMTTNFVEDAGRDPALRSLLRSGARDTIDLVYTGVPVRAHVGPLRPGLPWTLVVYRGHELEDRVAALTAALSIFFTVACLVLVALLAGILLFAAAHCWRPEALAGIPVTLGRVMAAGSRLARPCAAGVLVLLLYSPWIARHAWTLAGASPVLPFFAVCSILAVAALVGWCSFAEPPATDGDGGGDRTVRRVFGLAALVAVLAAVPPALWFVHHRAALGVGLNHYLMDQTLDSVDRAREDYRLDVLRRHGAGAAPAGDRARRRFREEPELHEGWLLRKLRPIVAFSELANQLMAYRALPPASADQVLSLRGVFSRTFGYDVGRPLWAPSAPGSGGFLLLVGLTLFGLALPIAAMAYTVCAACTLAGRRRRLSLRELPNEEELLRSAKRKPPVGRPLRAIVVSRSERCRGDFVRTLTNNLGLSRSDLRVERQTDGCLGYVVRWVPKVPKAGPRKQPLYVFDDLKEVLEDDGKGRALFDELERRVQDAESHVLIWSRVVPDYRYSDRLGRADLWFDRGHSDDEDRRDRWSGLARRFRVFVLNCSGGPDECTDVLVGDASKDREDAVTQLRKGAATSFNQLWTESTRDERLQLYALARGGAVNARRSAALSSLFNRGIVCEDPATGVVRVRSEAFHEFVEHDVDHRELNAWRRERGGVWRLIWPPVVIGGALGLAFLAMANPEMGATLLTTLVALLPVALPLLGAGRSAGPTGPPSG